MKKTLLTLIAFFCIVNVEAGVIKLKDGSLLQGDILQATKDGIQFRSYKTDGEVLIPWSKLADGHRRAILIQLRKDIVTPSSPIYVPALRVIKKHGGVVIGEDGGEKDGYLVLRIRDEEVPILPTNIELKETIEVNATEVWEPEKIVAEKITRLTRAGYTPKTGSDFLELGKFALSVKAHAKALEFFKNAAALDSSLVEQANHSIEETQRKIAEYTRGEFRGRLERYKSHRDAINTFAMLNARIKELEGDPVNDEERSNLAAEREEFLISIFETEIREITIAEFFRQVDKKMNEKVREKLDYAAAKSYAAGKAMADIRNDLPELVLSRYRTSLEEKYLIERRISENMSRIQSAGGNINKEEFKKTLRENYLRTNFVQPEEAQDWINRLMDIMTADVTSTFCYKMITSTRLRRMYSYTYGGVEATIFAISASGYTATTGVKPEHPNTDANEWWNGYSNKKSWLVTYFFHRQSALKAEERKIVCSRCRGKGSIEGVQVSEDGTRQTVPYACPRCYNKKYQKIVVNWQGAPEDQNVIARLKTKFDDVKAGAGTQGAGQTQFKKDAGGKDAKRKPAAVDFDF